MVSKDYTYGLEIFFVCRSRSHSRRLTIYGHLLEEKHIHVVFFTKGELTDLSLNNHSRNDETRPYYLHFPCRISLPTVQRSMKFSDVSDDTHLTRILSAAASDLRPTFLIRI